MQQGHRLQSLCKLLLTFAPLTLLRTSAPLTLEQPIKGCGCTRLLSPALAVQIEKAKLAQTLDLPHRDLRYIDPLVGRLHLCLLARPACARCASYSCCGRSCPHQALTLA